MLLGVEGADRLTGDVGDDVLTGGLGVDTFVYASGRDTVTDFEDDRDTISLDDALWGGRQLTPVEVLTFASVVRGGIVLDFGSGDQLVIAGFTKIDALLNDLDIF